MALKMNKSKTTRNPLCIPRGEDGKIRAVPFYFFERIHRQGNAQEKAREYLGNNDVENLKNRKKHTLATVWQQKSKINH